MTSSASLEMCLATAPSNLSSAIAAEASVHKVRKEVTSASNSASHSKKLKLVSRKQSRLRSARPAPPVKEAVQKTALSRHVRLAEGQGWCVRSEALSSVRCRPL